MKSLSYSEFGNPADVLNVIDQPMPEPKAGEVRIKMRLAPIHNHDLWTVKGSYGYKPSLPATAGSEAIGIIDQLGSDVEPFKIGQRVVASGVKGSWADYFIVSAQQIVPLPDDVSDEIGAQLIAMPLSTSLLLDFLQVKAGDWIIQNAANGAVGKTLAMLASKHGVHTINLVRREDVIDEMNLLGMENIVSTVQPGWKEEVQRLMGKETIARAIDSISGQDGADLLDLLGDGGMFVSFGAAKRQAIPIKSSDLIFRQITIKGFWGAKVSSSISADKKNAMIEELIGLAQQGDLILPVEDIFPLNEFQHALERQHAENRSGKVLLSP